MKKILIATGNKGKLRELLEGFTIYKADKNVKFLSLNDFPEIDDEPEENGQNYQENALIKAKFFAEKSGLPTIGEDSGLELSAFPDKFGLKTKREIPAKNDREWLEKFLEILSATTNRKATFFSAIAFYDPQNSREKIVLGKTLGIITKYPEAPLETGIPVSAVFRADDTQKVFSALSKEEKNKISHRGKAVRMMAEFLKNC